MTSAISMTYSPRSRTTKGATQGSAWPTMARRHASRTCPSWCRVKMHIRTSRSAAGSASDPVRHSGSK